jgi:quercetin dioxygenase-like cupin family protein
MSGREPDSRDAGSIAPETYFLPAGSGSKHVIFPGVEILTTAGKDLMLSVVRFEPHSVVLEHSHPHEQMGILLEGRVEFTIGGVTRLLGPGDVWRIPGGVLHRVRALDEPVRALDVFCPIREDYL